MSQRDEWMKQGQARYQSMINAQKMQDAYLARYGKKFPQQAEKSSIYQKNLNEGRELYYKNNPHLRPTPRVTTKATENQVFEPYKPIDVIKEYHEPMMKITGKSLKETTNDWANMHGVSTGNPTYSGQKNSMSTDEKKPTIPFNVVKPTARDRALNFRTFSPLDAIDRINSQPTYVREATHFSDPRLNLPTSSDEIIFQPLDINQGIENLFQGFDDAMGWFSN